MILIREVKLIRGGRGLGGFKGKGRKGWEGVTRWVRWWVDLGFETPSVWCELAMVFFIVQENCYFEGFGLVLGVGYVFVGFGDLE